LSLTAFSFSAPIGTFDRELEFTAFNKNEQYAAKFLGCSVEMLRAYRKNRIDPKTGEPRPPMGPEFRRLNGHLIRYSIQSLQSWVDAQERGGERASK
jgi:hypothetical protein